MKRLLSTAAPALAIVAVLPGGKTHREPHRHCPKLFTVRMGERAGRAIYRDGHNASRRNLRLLGTIERCQRNPRAQAFVRSFDRRQAAAHAQRAYEAAHPYSTAVASWYTAAGGPLACAGESSYAMGVANLTLPCGTRIEVCYATCVNAIVFDRGPYISGREFDLSEQVMNATGFPGGVTTIRWRLAR